MAGGERLRIANPMVGNIVSGADRFKDIVESISAMAGKVRGDGLAMLTRLAPEAMADLLTKHVPVEFVSGDECAFKQEFEVALTEALKKAKLI